jgi:hypothetical protein
MWASVTHLIKKFYKNSLLSHAQEAIMKFCWPVVYMVFLSVLVFGGQPAWSQETPQEATQAEAQPAVAGAAQPAAAGESQPVPPGESQPVPPGESQLVPPGGDQPTEPGESRTGVRIPEVVVCQDVVNRDPVGAGDVFAKEIPRIYCFTRVVGAEPGSALIHNWYYQGDLKASVELTVGSSDYRTWSYKTMTPQWTGEWRVEVLSAGGTPLGNIIFALK